MLRGVAAILVLSACGSVSNEIDAPPGVPDGGAARCDPRASFGAPTLVPELSSSLEDSALSLTRDELTAFVSRSNPGNTLLTARRASIAAAFSAPADDPALAAITGASGTEYSPWPTADALVLYFHRQDSGTIGIYVATRTSPTGTFNAGSAVSVNGTGLVNALSPRISADGQTLYWLDFQQFILFSAVRSTTPEVFTSPRPASTISPYNYVLSADELTIYYSDGVETDILSASRPTTTAQFATGVPVANVNSPQNDAPLFLTHDGCVLYLKSTRPGGLGGPDIWVARRP